MELCPLTKETEVLWDTFCQENGEAWFWQTTAFLKYQQTYRPSLGTVPKHFYLRREGQVVAICPLAVERIEVEGKAFKVFSLGGDALPTPVVSDRLAPRDRERLFHKVFETVESVASQEGIAKASFEESVLTSRFLSCSVAPPNPFVRFGYLDVSIQSQVLRLKAGEAHIWAGIRRAYHSLIHRAAENIQFRFLDRTTITEDQFRTYKELHRKAAGRLTRPEATFDMMLDWIRQGQAVLSQALLDGRVVGSILGVVYKSGVYYRSGCNDPDWEKRYALGHFLQWKTIQELIRRGITYYDLGWQLFGPQLGYVPSTEEVGIAFFKRGFGGIPVPLFRGERYFSAELFRKEYGQRLDQIATSCRSPISPRR